MPSELEQLLALWNHRPPGAAVLATVVHVEGSAYRRPGSRMLAFENGPRVGTISGGCLERDLLSKAFFLTREGPTTIDYDTRDGDMGDYNLGCRGLVRVLLQPLEQNPRPIELLSRVMQNDEPITTVTNHGITGDRPDAAIGDQFVFDRTGETQDRYPLWLNHAMGEIVNVIDDGLPRACRITHEGGRVNVLIERIDPPQPVIVFGAGHDAISLVNIAAEAGCAVTIVTHRPGQASAAQFNAARRRMDLQPSEIAARLTISNRTAAVVMTHDFETDLALLPALLDSPASYIGLLGPKARTARLLTDLHQRGRRLTPTDIARLRTPVGLDIGSITPQEIALSIVSEIIAVRNGRSGTPLRDREVTRHEPYRRDGMIELPSGVIVD